MEPVDILWVVWNVLCHSEVMKKLLTLFRAHFYFLMIAHTIGTYAEHRETQII